MPRVDEAQAAIKAAKASYERSKRDLEHQQRGADETNRALDKLRAHNAANNYGEWLRELVLGRA